MIKKLNSKTILSAILALTVSGLFCFSSLSYASSNGLDKAGVDGPVARSAASPAGVLRGTGAISLNGASTESGATVFSGSIITTGEDGIASIDLGPIGRITVRPQTTVTLTLSIGRATITGRSKFTRLNVLRGELMVTSPAAIRLLKSGEDATFGESVEATMTGDTVFTIQDRSQSQDQKDQGQKDQGQNNQGAQQDPKDADQNPPRRRRKNAVIVPWWGWLGLAGAAGGIAAGMATQGGERSSPNRVSPSQP